jgi:hypothetical protein
MGIDPARSGVGKHDFQPITEPIIHGSPNGDSGTAANWRNSSLARSEIAGFVDWIKDRQDLTLADKDRIASLAAEYARDKPRCR